MSLYDEVQGKADGHSMLKVDGTKGVFIIIKLGSVRFMNLRIEGISK